MANEITGRVEMIGTTQQFQSKDGQKTCQKRELILDASRYDTYTGEKRNDNHPVLEFNNDRCALLDALRVGDVVTVSFELNGIAYQDKSTGETKHMTKARGYKVEVKRAAQQPAQQQPPKQPVYASEPPAARMQASQGKLMDFPPAPPQNPHTGDGLPF